MNEFERRAFCKDAKFNTRDENGNLYIEGYFAVFGSSYEMWKGAIEQIDQEAFVNTLKNDDIRALVNHDTSLVLGRTTAGTLTLNTDERGLFGSILINRQDQDAMNLYERVKRGDVSQCSFGFDIIRQEIEEEEDGKVIFTLKEVKLYEVSVVTFPAYEETEVSARKKDYEIIRQKKNELWRNEMKKKLREEK
jgi:phage prohead protease, HK97 family